MLKLLRNGKERLERLCVDFDRLAKEKSEEPRKVFNKVAFSPPPNVAGTVKVNEEMCSYLLRCRAVPKGTNAEYRTFERFGADLEGEGKVGVGIAERERKRQKCKFCEMRKAKIVHRCQKVRTAKLRRQKEEAVAQRLRNREAEAVQKRNQQIKAFNDRAVVDPFEERVCFVFFFDANFEALSGGKGKFGQVGGEE
jgi:hypothetical protein